MAALCSSIIRIANMILSWTVKHVRYEFCGKRYECKTQGCPSFTYRGPDIHPKHGITWRLWHHIQRMALKRSVKDMVRLTGATDDQIRPAVMALAETLSKHHFSTPRVVAIDDIRLGKKRRFTVIYNGENGHPLAIVEKLDAKGIGAKLHEIIDPSQAEIFVSDMNGSNLLLGQSSFAGIPHVADKWHILDKMQRQMYRIANQTANKVRKGPAAELKSWKMEFEGKFAAVDAKIWRARLAGETVAVRQREPGDQQTLTLKTKWDMLKLFRLCGPYTMLACSCGTFIVRAVGKRLSSSLIGSSRSAQAPIDGRRGRIDSDQETGGALPLCTFCDQQGCARIDQQAPEKRQRLRRRIPRLAPEQRLVTFVDTTARLDEFHHAGKIAFLSRSNIRHHMPPLGGAKRSPGQKP